MKKIALSVLAACAMSAAHAGDVVIHAGTLIDGVSEMPHHKRFSRCSRR